MSEDIQKIQKSDDEWKKDLTPEQFSVLRGKATEAPFSGELVDNHEDGMYTCAGCGLQLFDSGTKFDSQSGWPSFTDPVNLEHVELLPDHDAGMVRTEVVCKRCGGHLGHVFDDGPQDKGGKRYCINSCVLKFNKKS